MRRRFVVAACVAVSWLAAAELAAAVDPFYEKLLRDGMNAATGDPGQAARKLRLACFGMLDEPPALANCYGHLALAEARVEGEPAKEALRDTVAQLLELERRFQAVGKMLAGWPAGDRAALERIIGANASFAVLNELPIFKLQAIRGLPVEDRRRELDRRQSVDPRNPDWRLLAAELYFESKQYAEAIREADHLLVLTPSLEAGRCLRGAAYAAMGTCGDTAMGDLALCRDPRMDLAQLRCLVKRGDLVVARSLLDRLTVEQRAADEVKTLEKELARLEKKAGS